MPRVSIMVTADPTARRAASVSPAPRLRLNRAALPTPISRAMDRQMVVSG